MIINISEAKTTLSKLVALVEEGKEFTIGRAGKPVARLTSAKKTAFPRSFQNEWKGKVRIAEDFDTLPEEFLSHFQ